MARRHWQCTGFQRPFHYRKQRQDVQGFRDHVFPPSASSLSILSPHRPTRLYLRTTSISNESTRHLVERGVGFPLHSLGLVPRCHTNTVTGPPGKSREEPLGPSMKGAAFMRMDFSVTKIKVCKHILE